MRKTSLLLAAIMVSMIIASAQPTSLGTNLAFRTQPGGVVVPAGQSMKLGAVDVSPFSKIRVIADERADSQTGVNIRLTITEGDEFVGQLDTLELTPGAQVTRVYDVPGTYLTVFADAVDGTGSDGVDVLIYGS